MTLETRREPGRYRGQMRVTVMQETEDADDEDDCRGGELVINGVIDCHIQS